jgi:hypothetical protein
MPGDLPRRIGWITAVVRVLCLVSGLCLLVSRAASVLGSSYVPVLGPLGLPLLQAWAGLTLLLFVATLVWMQAAVQNAQAMAPDPRRMRSWMAVVWWFLPPFAFFQPVRAMSQTYNTSVDRSDDINGTAASPVAGWWMLASLAAISALLAFSGMTDPATGAPMVPVDRWQNPAGFLLPAVLWLGALGCLATCVKRIATAQRGYTPDTAPAPQAA